MTRTPVPTGHRAAAVRDEVVAAARRLWLPALLLAAAMVGLGLLLTEVLDTGRLAREDRELSAELAAAREPDEVELTSVLTVLADTPTVVALTAVAAVAFRRLFHRWRESVVVVCAVAGETLIFWLTTLVIDRPRPRIPQLDPAPPTSGFPSGHTAASMAFYGAVALVVLWHTRHRWVGRLALLLAFLVALAVGGSRLYRGMHYPTDVVAGLLLGSVWLGTVGARLRPDRPATR